MLNKTELVEPTNQYKYKPDYADASEAEIEDYLDHFSAPLVGRVAYQERTKMRNDLRHQMEQVIVAYQELGSTRAEAVAEALQQFRQTAQTPVVENECMDSLQTKEIQLQQKSRLEFALKSFGITALIEFIMVVSLVRANASSSEFNFSMLLIIALAPPAFAGAYFGYRNSNRILGEVLNAHLLLVLPVALIAVFLSFIISPENRNTLEGVILVTASWFFTCLPSGSVGAVVGKWLKRTNILDKIDPPTPVRNPQDRAL